MAISPHWRDKTVSASDCGARQYHPPVSSRGPPAHTAPTMVMPGHNDVHPRRLAEAVHRLVPSCEWAEVMPHSEEPESYVKRVLGFLSDVEAGNRG